jgi:hypothetical protein
MKERDRQAFAERDRERIEAERQRLIFDTAIRNGIPLSRIASSAPMPVASQPMQQPALPSSASSEEGVSLIDAARQIEQNNASVVPQNIVGESVTAAKPPQQKVNVFNVDPSYIAVSDVQQEGIAAEQAIAQERERQIKGYEQNAESFGKEFKIKQSEYKNPTSEESDKYQLYLGQLNALNNQYDSLAKQEQLLLDAGKEDKAAAISRKIQNIDKERSKFASYETLDEVKAILNTDYSNNMREYGKRLRQLKETINTAKQQFKQVDGTSAAIGTIQRFIAPQVNSIISPNAIGEAEAVRLTQELIPIVGGKNQAEKLINKLKTGEPILEDLMGTNVKGYLERVEQVTNALTSVFNEDLNRTVIKPLGKSYALMKGYQPISINGNAPTGNAPQGGGIPGLDQGATQSDPLKKPVKNTSWTLGSGGIAPK